MDPAGPIVATAKVMERWATEIRKRLLVLTGVASLILLAPLEAAAQQTESSQRDTPKSAVTLAEVRRSPVLDLTPQASWVIGTPGVQGPQFSRLHEQQAARSDRRTKTRAFFGAVVGATGGFFAGGYTGAWIEGDRCHCDDPGLKGALIGAPIGAVVGGILGGLFLF